MPDTLAYHYCHSPNLKDNGTTLEECVLFETTKKKKKKSEMVCAYLRALRANSSTSDVNLSLILTTI